MALLSKTTLLLVAFYQKTISPDHGSTQVPFFVGSCRFFPSCSQYTSLAIQKKGFFKGIASGAWRILRCNPFSRGGYDPA